MLNVADNDVLFVPNCKVVMRNLIETETNEVGHVIEKAKIVICFSIEHDQC